MGGRGRGRTCAGGSLWQVKRGVVEVGVGRWGEAGLPGPEVRMGTWGTGYSFTGVLLPEGGEPGLG